MNSLDNYKIELVYFDKTEERLENIIVHNQDKEIDFLKIGLDNALQTIEIKYKCIVSIPFVGDIIKSYKK